MIFKNLKRLIKDNEGLSLVELIISIAILAIVGIAITAFMSTGSVSYAKTSAEVDLQYDAQLAMNQLQDYLIDATEGISYEIDGTTITASSPADDMDTGTSKVLTIMTVDKTDSTYFDAIADNEIYYADIITWTGADGSSQENTLYYSRNRVTKTAPATPADFPTYSVDTSSYIGMSAPVMMSEYITGFALDFSALEKKNYININVRYKKGSREYETHHDVALRNNLAIFTPGTVTSGGPGGGGLTGVVTGVTISPSSVVATPDSTHTFITMVHGTGSISQAVTFSIPELVNDPSSSYPYTPELAGYVSIDSATGKLTINPLVNPAVMPTCLETFHVVATCWDNPATTSVDESNYTATATVHVKDVLGISLSAPTTCKQGEVASCSASVTGLNITSSAADQAIVWKVTSGSSYVVQTGVGQYKVKETAPVDATFTVSVTSALKNGITQSATITITKGDETAPDSNQTISLTGDFPDKLKRGQSAQATAKASSTTGYDIVWTVKFKSGTTEFEEGSVYTVVRSGSKCKISLLKSFDYNSTGKFYVEALLVPSGKGVDAAVARTGQRVIDVEPVYVRFIEDNVEKTNVKRTIYAVKQGATKIKYELHGIVNGDLTWKVSNDELLKAVNEGSESKLYLYAKSQKKAGKGITVKPVISNKTFTSTADVDVSPGNLYWSYKGNYSAANNWQGELIEKYAYMPLPTEDDFPGNKAKAGVGDVQKWNPSTYPQILNITNIENSHFHLGYKKEWRNGKEVDVWYLAISQGMTQSGQYNLEQQRVMYEWNPVEYPNEWHRFQ